MLIWVTHKYCEKQYRLKSKIFSVQEFFWKLYDLQAKLEIISALGLFFLNLLYKFKKQ